MMLLNTSQLKTDWLTWTFLNLNLHKDDRIVLVLLYQNYIITQNFHTIVLYSSLLIWTQFYLFHLEYGIISIFIKTLSTNCENTVLCISQTDKETPPTHTKYFVIKFLPYTTVGAGWAVSVRLLSFCTCCRWSLKSTRRAMGKGRWMQNGGESKNKPEPAS